MLSDDRSVNLVQELLGIIPGQTRSYVSSATGSISLGGTPLSPQQLPIHTANSITGITYGVPSRAIIGLMTLVSQTLTATAGSRTILIGSAASIPAGTAIYVKDNTVTPTLYQPLLCHPQVLVQHITRCHHQISKQVHTHTVLLSRPRPSPTTMCRTHFKQVMTLSKKP